MIDQVDSSAAQRSRGEWIPFLLVGALFVLVTVQASFVYLAVSTDPGIAIPNAYERGLAHNAVLREAAIEATLGWRIDVENRATNGHAGRVTVTALTRAGFPLDDLRVTGLLLRPTRAGFDHALAFEPAGNGRYVANYALPLAGLWDLGLLLDGAAGTAQRTMRFSVP
jgi:nitrogen fixation protein FixH